VIVRPPIRHGSENRLTRMKDFSYDDAILNERSVIGVMPCHPLSGRSKQSSRIALSSSGETGKASSSQGLESSGDCHPVHVQGLVTEASEQAALGPVLVNGPSLIEASAMHLYDPRSET